MLPMVVSVLVVLAVAVIGMLLYYFLAAADEIAGDLARPFNNDPIGSHGGLVGGLLAAIPLGSTLVLVGVIGAMVYFLGASGVVICLAVFVLLVDACAIWACVTPSSDPKSKERQNLIGNRAVLLLNTLEGMLLYVIGMAALYISGCVPAIVGPWVYAGSAIEVFVLLLCCFFRECYCRDPQKYQWESAKTKWAFVLRNLLLAAIAIGLALILAVGFAPTANTYSSIMTPEGNETVGLLIQTWALFLSLGVFTLTMPVAPLWVPVYWLGFEQGILLIAVECLAVAYLAFVLRNVGK